jgi:hypothetical protein
MLRSWRASAPAAAARQLGSGPAALLELGPALSGISRPRGIKAVSRQLLTTQQGAMLDHVVRWGRSYLLQCAVLSFLLGCPCNVCRPLAKSVHFLIWCCLARCTSPALAKQ